MKSWFKKTLITGIILILPLAVSLWIVITVFQRVDGIFRPLIIKFFGFPVPALGFLFTFILIWLIGIIGTNFIGKRLFAKLDQLMLKVPLFSVTYGTTKQLIDAFEMGQKIPFKKVVLLEYPRKNLFSIAFVTNIAQGEIQDITPQKLVTVFYVTTPNPTSGVILFVPEEELIPLSMHPEDALKLIVSGGFFTPEYPPNATAITLPATV
ncbi:MAG: hypothetical protein A2Y62_21080 [Candidatus Fischerbacteria bacterium RBG_13_37_8]|uniref:DUF502 domain-containing protein n=1 Tax=Candidatus Fischerbacteria bacterium RBG_13_37_8 TaxID=1817863 RepID=A0A1F5V6C7_9BACT|nr:MAG: hypothetical protein A2Y62_21080 [Candidatus Fischerbacteria bacterium RBG_13_37_8]